MLNSEKAILAMNDIDDNDLESAREMLGYKTENKVGYAFKKRIITFALAAALILSLSVSAYAANLFGLRELFANPNRGEMPEEAAALIVNQNAETEGDGWRAQVMESYCDEGTVMVAVRVSADTRYLVVPTDADQGDPLSEIGLSGEGTIGEYARQERKTLLFVEAVLDQEKLGLISAGQRFENISPQEIVIYFEGARRKAAAAPTETTCTVVAVMLAPGADEQNEDTCTVKRYTLPVSLSEGGSSPTELYVPVDPYAVPGFEIGELSLTRTPLGISLRLKLSTLDQNAAEKLLTLWLDGVEFHGAGVIDPDGYAVFSQGQGDYGDNPTIRFLNWDKETIAVVPFDKVD